MLNPQWLKTFITLSKEGHFTRTAEKLAMTQPGVTQHVHKLEQYFSAVLLDRNGKQIALTPQGKEVLSFAKQWFNELEKLEEKITNDDPYNGECRIITSGSLGLLLYPQFTQLQQRYPELSIQHEFAPNSAIHQGVEQNLFDWGISSALPESPHLNAEKISYQTLQIILPVSWTFDIPLKTLLDRGFINHPDGVHYLRRIYDNNLPQHHFQPEKIHTTGYVNHISLILEPVSKGIGYTTLPEHALTSSPYKHLVQRYPLKQTATEPLYLITRKQQTLLKRHQWLIEQCRYWLKTD
ncbi:LysR family transcriptional regulator [Thaumasiovibrio sp. DFM-14]|uniref:LysR family transcriptional regulator n=1 Tax=Thaumasiovibrio sp. DFM-14 TaxID=3384792 RepID=UPI0039A2B1D4